MGLLLFKKVFADPIRQGTKRTTLRRWKRPRVQPGRRAFCPGLGYLRIESVEPIELSDLEDPDAQADGFTTLADLLHPLGAMYPDQATDGKQWWRVRFHWDGQ